jgi:hypothetical protein
MLSESATTNHVTRIFYTRFWYFYTRFCRCDTWPDFGLCVFFLAVARRWVVQSAAHGSLFLIWMYLCVKAWFVCVCVCACLKEREERERDTWSNMWWRRMSCINTHAHAQRACNSSSCSLGFRPFYSNRMHQNVRANTCLNPYLIACVSIAWIHA